MPTKAQALTKSIRQLLALHGFYSWKGGSTASRNKDGGFYMTGTPGSPDVYAVKGQWYVLIEVKAGHDQMRDSQKSFQAEIERVFGNYLVARSVDDVLRWIKDEEPE